MLHRATYSIRFSAFSSRTYSDGGSSSTEISLAFCSACHAVVAACESPVILMVVRRKQENVRGMLKRPSDGRGHRSIVIHLGFGSSSGIKYPLYDLRESRSLQISAHRGKVAQAQRAFETEVYCRTTRVVISYAIGSIVQSAVWNDPSLTFRAPGWESEFPRIPGGSSLGK